MAIVRIVFAISCMFMFFFYVAVSFWTFEVSTLQNVIKKNIAD